MFGVSKFQLDSGATNRKVEKLPSSIKKNDSGNLTFKISQDRYKIDLVSDNLSVTEFKFDDSEEQQHKKLNHGEEYKFRIGQKDLDLGHLRMSNFSSTMAKIVSTELAGKNFDFKAF